MERSNESELKWSQTDSSNNEDLSWATVWRHHPDLGQLPLQAMQRPLRQVADLQAEDLGSNSVSPLHLVPTGEGRKTSTPACSFKLKILCVEELRTQ